MSNSEKPKDIEDVLSSIRRLVAENARLSKDSDALVLTQNHRVEQSSPQSAASPSPSTSENTANLAVPQHTQSTLRAEPVLTQRPQPTPAPQEKLDDAPLNAPETSTAPTFRTAAQVPNPATPNPDINRSGNERPRVYTIPPIAAARAEKPSNTPAPSEPPRAEKSFVPKAPPVLPTEPYTESDDVKTEIAETALLEQEINNIETNADLSESHWETDDSFATDNIGIPSENGMPSGIDEGVLRDLVADIVREELRGTLGEKITLNVRKLVRREIQRALTTQNLE